MSSTASCCNPHDYLPVRGLDQTEAAWQRPVQRQVGAVHPEPLAKQHLIDKIIGVHHDARHALASAFRRSS